MSIFLLLLTVAKLQWLGCHVKFFLYIEKLSKSDTMKIYKKIYVYKNFASQHKLNFQYQKKKTEILSDKFNNFLYSIKIDCGKIRQSLTRTNGKFKNKIGKVS